MDKHLAAQEFPSGAEKMINVGILAHVDAGKTTLTEQLLFASGAIRQAGRVDEGTAQTDTMEIERSRGISVRSAPASLTYDGVTVNLIDTPGHVDFAGEVERSLGALDCAVLVVSAVEGVQSHTENIFKELQSHRIPRIVFINKIDRMGADSGAVLREMQSRLKSLYLPVSAVHDEGEKTVSVSLLAEEDFDGYRETLAEILSELYDEIAELYLADEPIPDELIESCVKDAVAKGNLTPVLCGSSLLGIGIEHLLRLLTSDMPRASKKETPALSGLIYKIEHDRTMGKMAYVRLFGGSIKNRDTVPVVMETADSVRDLNEEDPDAEAAGEAEESPKLSVKENKVTQIRKLVGAKAADAGTVSAGETAVLCGLSNARTGCWIGEVTGAEKSSLAHPFLCVKVSPETPDKLTPLVEAIAELSDEEPYINYRWEKGEREININLTGEIQMEVISSLLRERYNLNAHFSSPSVIYKETPSQKGYGFDAYTMPKPCWAVVKFLIEPLPLGSGVEYGGRIKSNKLFYKYQTHIKSSFITCLEQGLHGWEVTDLRVTLVDGEHHTIHTHPLDFFVATPMAFMDGLRNTGTDLLEPMLKVRMTAPADLAGKIISDIIAMSGEFDSPVIDTQTCTFEAMLPVAKSMDYPVRFASLTGGRGIYTPAFAGYRKCAPGEGVERVRTGINPLDRAKWILYARGAIQ